MEKLTHVMEWREEAGAPEMESLVHLANGSEYSDAAKKDPEKLVKAKALAVSLNNASIYWHGFTKEGKPILWIRCGRKPWYLGEGISRSIEHVAFGTSWVHHSICDEFAHASYAWTTCGEIHFERYGWCD